MPKLKQTTVQDRIYYELIEMRKHLDRLIMDYQATLPKKTAKRRVPKIYNPFKKGGRKKNG
jgi:hypothetical protein